MHDLSAEPVSGFVWRHPLKLGVRGPTGRYFGRLAAAIAACVVSVSSLDAADIKDGSALGEVVLEGTIVSGDYDKLLSFVDANEARSIYLASPGGSVTEAIKIGRLVRALRLETIIPVQLRGDLREKAAEHHKLTNPKANYLCASACFFVFVAGVKRDHDLLGDPILGIHRPYLTDSDLKTLSGSQAIASGSQLRTMVDSYLKEMGVPAKYADLMFSVPKDEVRWIGSSDFEIDLEGIVPELKDWVEARCDTRTDVEKAAWANLKNKSPAQMTAAERSISEMLLKKMSVLDECGSKALSELSHQAHLKMFWEPRRTAFCAEYHSDGHLDAKLVAAVPNEASAAALRDDVQNATLCGDYATRAKIIRALAERGDAGSQTILGAMYFYGGAHASRDSISQDKPEGVKWFRRAADQGDDEAQGQLSSIYFGGDGVPQNYVEALKWLTLQASRNKDKEDDTLRQMFTSKMTTQQIAEAQRLASQWRPTPERSDRDHSSVLPAKSKSPWWQFWK
jgi:hypothetical protein